MCDQCSDYVCSRVFRTTYIHRLWVLNVIFWDIDGPVRRLDKAVFKGETPDTWDQKTKNGRTLFQEVNATPELCLLSEPSEYLPLLNSMKRVTFLSNQPLKWQHYTLQWLNIYVRIPYKVVFTKDWRDKMGYLKMNDFLIEDFPCFSSYDQIVLIDRPYNRHVVCPRRASTPEELEALIATLK